MKVALGSNSWPVLSEVRMETVCEDFRSMLVGDHCQLRDFLKVAHGHHLARTVQTRACSSLPNPDPVRSRTETYLATHVIRLYKALGSTPSIETECSSLWILLFSWKTLPITRFLKHPNSFFWERKRT